MVNGGTKILISRAQTHFGSFLVWFGPILTQNTTESFAIVVSGRQPTKTVKIKHEVFQNHLFFLIPENSRCSNPRPQLISFSIAVKKVWKLPVM